MYIGLHAKYPLFSFDFNKTRIFLTDFRKIFKFHENPYSGSRVVPCGRTDGRTGMTKLIIAFRNFANARKTDSSTCVVPHSGTQSQL
jgi:hypothetical protein